jgi:hypothetical protein
VHYWSQHVLRVVSEVAAGVILFSGTVAVTVITVVPSHHSKPQPSHIAMAAPVKSAVKPSIKKPTVTPPPAPAPVAPPPTTPVVQPVHSPPVAAAPVPVAIARTQPSPGSGVKHLSQTPPSPPATAPSQPAPTTTTAPAPTSTTSPDTATTSPPPASTGPAPATGGFYSTNWSGYAASSGKFTAITGSWKVPLVTGNHTSTTGDAAWVGIGGIASNDLIQAGTLETVAADGTVSYAAFYEILPDPAMELTSFAVHAGDTIAVSVNQVSTGQWNISITDSTSGQIFTTSLAYTSSYSSAEWIEEDPSYGNGTLIPFDNFDHVPFTNGTTIMNGLSTTPATSNAAPITLLDSANKPIATPSVLTGNGDSFWVTHN